MTGRTPPFVFVHERVENYLVFVALLAIFVIVPLLELWVIFEVGAWLGFLNTFLVLILVSVAGAALAKQQGFRAIERIRHDISQGRMPGEPLLDGALILSAAVLLLTPGFITDVVGIALLLPPGRALVRRGLRRWLERTVKRRKELGS